MVNSFFYILLIGKCVELEGGIFKVGNILDKFKSKYKGYYWIDF